MLTNSVRPSGLKVDPANSSPKRGVPVLLTSRLRAMFPIWPRDDSDRR
jgi:hypothetical protein